MKKVNKFNVACRLFNIQIGGAVEGWKTLCPHFGPLVWDTLSPQDKEWFKWLADNYKTTETHQYEKSGGTITPYQFLQAIFGDDVDMMMATSSILQPGVTLLLSD